jgi:hypothetical protein
VLQTVEAMDAQTREGAIWLTDHAVRTSAAAPLDVLAEWETGQTEGLAALQDLVPDAAAEAVGRSLTLLAEIGARADGLQAALDCPTGPAVDGTDGLGPVPVPCPAPASAPPATGGGTTRTGTSAPGGGAPAETTPAAPAAGPGSGGSGSGSSGSGGAGSGGAGSSGTAPSGLSAPVVPTPTRPGACCLDCRRRRPRCRRPRPSSCHPSASGRWRSGTADPPDHGAPARLGSSRRAPEQGDRSIAGGCSCRECRCAAAGPRARTG